MTGFSSGRTAVRLVEFQSNRKCFFIGAAKVSLFYGGMRAGQETETKPDWWVAAIPQINARALPHRTTRARRDERQAKNARVAVILCLFLVLLAAALLAGGRGVIDPLLRAAADQREAKRIGEIVYKMADGEFCRHLSFNNTTGELTQGNIGECPHDVTKDRARAAIGFAWGKR